MPSNMLTPMDRAKSMSRANSAVKILHVEISDQGIGLPKDFDIDQPRASLGFKVIKSLLGQLDGRIRVSSNEPKGAAIQLDLPLDLPS